MSLLSRHILRSFIPPFGWGVAALTGMLLLNNLASLIDKLGGRGLPARIMVEAVVLALPALMVLTLPMAALCATLYSYGQLSADLELVAMYANGVSVWRMARPALGLALVISLVNFLLFDQFVPQSNVRLKALMSDVQQKWPTLDIRPRQLNVLSSYVLVAEEKDSISEVFRVVTIYDLGGRGPQRVIHADSGTLAGAPNRTDMLLTLHHGEILEFPAMAQGQAWRTTFEIDRFRLRNVTNDFNPRGDQGNARGDREMSGCQLLDGVSEYRWNYNDGKSQRELLTRRDLRRLAGLSPVPPPSTQLRPKMEKHCGLYRRGEEWLEKRLLTPTALANKIADSIAEERLEHLRLQELARAAEAQRQLELSERAGIAPPRGDSAAQFPLLLDAARAAAQLPPSGLPKPEDSLRAAVSRLPVAGDSQRTAVPGLSTSGNSPRPLPPQAAPPPRQELGTSWSEVLAARQEMRIAQERVAAYQVEFHKKWAIPLSTFCFVLLGLALALRYPRGGIGLVIGASLIIFMIFYIFIIGGENLAKKLYIDPVAAMHGPLLAFTLLGIIWVARANREMGSARGGSGLFSRLADLMDRLRGKPL